MSGQNRPPCVACKILSRNCRENCIFAPHFPPHTPEEFENIRKVFSVSCIQDRLFRVHPNSKEYAINSIAYEAAAIVRDPVHGCLGQILHCEQRLQQRTTELEIARQELSILQSNYQMLQQQQQQELRFLRSQQQKHLPEKQTEYKMLHQQQELLESQNLSVHGGGTVDAATGFNQLPTIVTDDWSLGTIDKNTFQIQPKYQIPYQQQEQLGAPSLRGVHGGTVAAATGFNQLPTSVTDHRSLGIIHDNPFQNQPEYQMLHQQQEQLGAQSLRGVHRGTVAAATGFNQLPTSVTDHRSLGIIHDNPFQNQPEYQMLHQQQEQLGAQSLRGVHRGTVAAATGFNQLPTSVTDHRTLGIIHDNPIQNQPEYQMLHQQREPLQSQTLRSVHGGTIAAAFGFNQLPSSVTDDGTIDDNPFQIQPPTKSPKSSV